LVWHVHNWGLPRQWITIHHKSRPILHKYSVVAVYLMGVEIRNLLTGMFSFLIATMNYLWNWQETIFSTITKIKMHFCKSIALYCLNFNKLSKHHALKTHREVTQFMGLIMTYM
jgi:hypothetical protein